MYLISQSVALSASNQAVQRLVYRTGQSVALTELSEQLCNFIMNLLEKVRSYCSTDKQKTGVFWGGGLTKTQFWLPFKLHIHLVSHTYSWLAV